MTIIDLSWRLPGPLGTYLLAKQGCTVIKYEDREHRDPFLLWSWDDSFTEIYNAFQSPKQVRLIDFGSGADVDALHQNIATADAVVMSLPERVEQKLGLTEDEIARRFNNVCAVRLGFRPGGNEHAHDLNTLAHSGLLNMHVLERTDRIIAPPFLPVTGIVYAHHIAVTVLHTILQQKKQSAPIQTWCYLQDAVDNVRQTYYPESIRHRDPATFLHNGRFPCYNIYRTSDGGHLAIAAVEQKFWKRFRELAGLEQLSDDDGLSHGTRAQEVKEIIASVVEARTAAEWHTVFSGENCCVDVVEDYNS